MINIAELNRQRNLVEIKQILESMKQDIESSCSKLVEVLGGKDV
jgi:hypothetical protein